jgi:xanthine dehydrogenase YagS FAD-binding subunit
MCVALAVLDAIVEVEGPQGARQIPLGEFHRLPGETPERDTVLEPAELITSIVLPPLPWSKSGVYLKIRDRASYAFALISVAAIVDLDGDRIRAARLALGGVAHKPWRPLEAEAFLYNQPVSTATFTEAARIALRDAQPLTHNHFKVELARRAIVRSLSASTQGQGLI